MGGVADEPSIVLEDTREDVLEAARGAAELWGGEWQDKVNGGTVVLPVVAGLRRGFVRGRVVVRDEGQGHQRLTLEVEEEFYRLHWSAVMILVLGAGGALVGLLWPFFPESLLPLAGLSGLLAMVAWFLVLARLRTSGPEDWLSLIAHLLAEPDGEIEGEPLEPGGS